jgi:hypothetical protein
LVLVFDRRRNKALRPATLAGKAAIRFYQNSKDAAIKAVCLSIFYDHRVVVRYPTPLQRLEEAPPGECRVRLATGGWFTFLGVETENQRLPANTAARLASGNTLYASPTPL